MSCISDIPANAFDACSMVEERLVEELCKCLKHVLDNSVVSKLNYKSEVNDKKSYLEYSNINHLGTHCNQSITV